MLTIYSQLVKKTKQNNNEVRPLATKCNMLSSCLQAAMNGDLFQPKYCTASVHYIWYTM